MGDYHVDRPQVEAQQWVKPSGTNSPFDLHTYRKKDLLSCQVSLGTIAEGKHPVSIPNPAVKPSSADDTVPGERHGKVGRPGGLIKNCYLP